jgi:hypothetical protein
MFRPTSSVIAAVVLKTVGVWVMGLDAERHVELLCSGKDGPESFAVQKIAVVVVLYHCSNELKTRGTPNELMSSVCTTDEG